MNPGSPKVDPTVDVVHVTLDSESPQPGPSRRQAIIDTAAALFDQAGYHKTSLTDVAAAVGIAKPTLYHYFTSKEEILFWIHDDFISQLIARQERREGTGLSAMECLQAIIHDLLDMMVDHRGHIRAFYDTYRELSSRWQAPIRLKRDLYFRVVVDVIQQGVQDGIFRPEAPDLMAFAVIGMCSWAYTWYSQSSSKSADDIARLYSDILLHGLQLHDSHVDTSVELSQSQQFYSRQRLG